MSERLAALARRVESDPGFLAFALADYARANGLTDSALAERLGCSPERLPAIRLCRMPRSAPSQFQADVDRIADAFHINAAVIAEAVRLSEALLAVRRRPGHAGTLKAAEDQAGYLMAARDRADEEDDDDDPEDEP